MPAVDRQAQRQVPVPGASNGWLQRDRPSRHPQSALAHQRRHEAAEPEATDQRQQETVDVRISLVAQGLNRIELGGLLRRIPPEENTDTGGRTPGNDNDHAGEHIDAERHAQSEEQAEQAAGK